MITKEYRVVLPISVEEYQVGQLYSTAEASKKETGGGEGVEVLVNEPYEENGVKGQYTHKVFHMKRNMPRIISGIINMLAPEGSLDLHERAWNAYPYCRTITTHQYMKDNFFCKVDTWHKPDMGEEDNVHELDAKEWENVEVVRVDIASPVSKADYKPDEDPATFRSEVSGRGPLGPDWKKGLASDSACPHMCAYKLITVKFKWWGLQSTVENLMHSKLKRLVALFNRLVFCWLDRWINLSMDDIRRMEEDTQKQLEEMREKGEYNGMGLQ